MFKKPKALGGERGPRKRGGSPPAAKSLECFACSHFSPWRRREQRDREQRESGGLRFDVSLSHFPSTEKKNRERKPALSLSLSLSLLRLSLFFYKMYNGIGLSTVRGSGTSGHVQTNKFAVRNRASDGNDGSDRRKGNSSKAARPEPNAAILEHNRLREIEVKLAELEDELEERG